jgi:hypothetical protein
MNTIKMPGFNAEASLYVGKVCYPGRYQQPALGGQHEEPQRTVLIPQLMISDPFVDDGGSGGVSGNDSDPWGRGEDGIDEVNVRGEPRRSYAVSFPEVRVPSTPDRVPSGPSSPKSVYDRCGLDRVICNMRCVQDNKIVFESCMQATGQRRDICETARNTNVRDCKKQCEGNWVECRYRH